MSITVAMRTQVSQLYVSLFGRAPDGEGLGYWVGQLAGGKTVAQVAQDMFNVTAARAYYPSFMTNDEIVAAFYVNVLGRTADAEGQAYWVGQMNKAGATKGSVIADMINAVVNYTGTDAAGVKSKALFNNKVEVAQYYGEKNGTVAGATAALAGVTEVAATVTAGKAAVDAGANPGQTFTLTAGRDTLVGTTGNDTFNATEATLTDLDTVDGGAGADTLNLVSQTAVKALPVAFKLSNVETFNVSSASDVGTVGSNAVTAVAAVKQVVKVAISSVLNTVDTYTVTMNGASYTTAASDADATKAEAAAKIASAINVLAGASIAAAVGDDVIVTAPTAGTPIPTIAVVSKTSGTADNTNRSVVSTLVANVAAVAAEDAVAAASYDVSALTVDTVNVNSATSANLKAAVTADVNVSGVTGAITVEGGKAVTVTDATADKAITLSKGAGSATVIDAKQGTGAISIDDAVGVTVEASGVTTGTVTIGANTEVTGAVSVNSTGAAYVAATAATLGAIRVDGGSTVNIAQVASSDTSKAAKDGAAATRTQSDVRVDAGDTTTSITITQDAAVDAVNAVTAVAAKAATQTLTVKAMAAGDVFKLTFDTNDFVTFKAARALTATEAAYAFANWVKLATEGSAPAADGTYAYGGTIDKEWTSGAVTTSADGTSATVVFSTATATPTDLVASVETGTAGAFVDSAVTAGATEVAAKTGVMGVATGAIDINGTTSGKDALTTVTFTNFASANIESDVITTLNATGTAGAVVVATASTGVITVNANDFKTGSQLSLANLKTVTINTSGKSVVTDLIADAATALTINAGVAFTSEGDTSLDALKTLVVTGAGKVNLDAVDATLADTITSVNASGNSGGLTITIGSDTATYVGSSGSDVVTTDSETVSKAIDLGAGDDTFVLAAYSSGTVVTAALNGGEGTDTMSMSVAAAAALDGNGDFKAAISSFERLLLNDKPVLTTADVTIDLATLGFTNYVTTSGTDDTDNNAANKLILDKLANNGTVVLTGTMDTSSGGIAVQIKDAATGTADVLNLVARVANDVNLGTLTVANTETVNIATEDTTPVDTTTGVATINKATLAVVADKVTTLVATGAAHLTLDTTSSTLVTVDASGMTGKFEYTADGKATGSTVIGGSGADTLVASGSSDVLIGGAGNDKLTAATLTTLTGGEGKDTFVLSASTAIAEYSTITDLTAGDIIDTTAVSFKSDAIALAGTATFADYANAAVNAVNSNAGDAAAWFQFGGNTYLVIDADATANNASAGDGTAGFTSGDMLIAITGLVDLSKAVFNATTGDLTIV